MFHFQFSFKEIAQEQNAYIKLLNDNIEIENNLELFYSANNYSGLINQSNETTNNNNFPSPSKNESKNLNLTD